MTALPAPLPFRPSGEISDLDAIAAVARGQREMFEVIVRRYNPQLYRVGMAYLRDHAQAEDAMQNAYLKAFLHLDRFKRDAAFSTWLTRIMINECLMLLRGSKRATQHTADLRLVDDEHSTPAEAARNMNLQEKKTVLEAAIANLPRNYRAVYLLREVQQLSTAETAGCLKISVDSVKVLLHRARERLKTELLKSAAGVELFAYPATYCDPLTTRVMSAIAAAKV
jgi:RNA polymerase sigma factor (sigma-70 family)